MLWGCTFSETITSKRSPSKLRLILGHWKEKSDEKWMAQLWLKSILDLNILDAQPKLLTGKPKLLSKHLQTVLQRSKIHLRSWSCRPTHLSIRPQGSIGEDRLWSTPKAKRRGPLHLRIDTQENVGTKAIFVIYGLSKKPRFPERVPLNCQAVNFGYQHAVLTKLGCWLRELHQP